MLLCDRCKKVGSVTMTLEPARGTDLCVECVADYRALVAKFLGAQSFDVKAPDLAPDPVFPALPAEEAIL